MTLLIDADYLIYNSCCACEQDTRWNEWEHTLHTDERDIMNLIENRLAFYQSVAGSKHDVVMCFSSYPTFRHEIIPEYKYEHVVDNNNMGNTNCTIFLLAAKLSPTRGNVGIKKSSYVLPIKREKITNINLN